MLKIKDLKVNVGEKNILKGINLSIDKGQIHVLMGPNGAGKSTLMNAIMDHPKYEVVGGSINFEGEEISELGADERAKRGIFMSFQNPEEVAGISVENFLRTAKITITEENQPILKFKKELKAEMQALGMKESYAERYLNVGFSGGEKKKAEILQMKILDPKLIMLDETDSGLDVDATRMVSEAVKNFLNEEKSLLIITHHRQILEFIKPDFVHVLIDGKIVKSGDARLIDQIEEKGYGWIREEVANG